MKAFLAVIIQKYLLLIIITLLLTALVVIAILKDRFLQLIGVVDPWAEMKALEAQCNDKCSYWCERHLDKPGTIWDKIELYLPRGNMTCDDVMREILGENIGNCSCKVL